LSAALIEVTCIRGQDDFPQPPGKSLEIFRTDLSLCQQFSPLAQLIPILDVYFFVALFFANRRIEYAQ
jgi:hypothetical protein